MSTCLLAKIALGTSLTIVLSALPIAPAHSQTNANLDAALKASSTGRERLQNKCDLRTSPPKDWVRTDVDGDGKEEIVAPYVSESCGGGNNWSVSIGVFRRDGSLFKLIDTKPIQGSIEKVTASGPRITVQTLAYGSDDPRCCPSKKSTEFFIWSNNQLRSVP